MSKVKVYSCGTYNFQPEEQELSQNLFELEELLFITDKVAALKLHEIMRQIFELPDLVFALGKTVDGKVHIVVFPVRPRPGIMYEVNTEDNRPYLLMETGGCHGCI